MPSSGFLYIATGKRFIDEASASLASLKRHMPQTPVCCFTDDPDYARQGGFSEVVRIENPYRNFLEKIPPLWETPFDRTVFVDTDTVFAAPMEEVFEVLERFELAVVPDPFWVEAPDTPRCFQHFNTGLIAYQKSERVFSFFRTWFSEFQAGLARDPKNPNHWHDQVIFQKELYRSDLRFYVLPGEYNLRVTCPQLIRIWAKARMLHGRPSEDLVSAAENLNRGTDFRIAMPNLTFVERTEVHLVAQKNRRAMARLMALVRGSLRGLNRGRSLLKRS